MPSQIKVDEIKNVAGQYKIKTNVFEGQTTAGSITVQGEGTATTNLQQGLAKFWAGSIVHSSDAVGDSFNMSGSTDGGTGRTDCSFTNNMSNNNCSVTYTCTGQYPYQGFMNDTSSVRHTTINSSNSFVDASGHLTLHGDLA